MKVSVQLDFNEMKIDINSLVYNAKSEFYDFYKSTAVKELVDVEEVDKQVFEQVNQKGTGSFVAKKDDIPFEVIIYWKESQLEVKSLDNQKQADLEFYISRCIEVCHNFAMLELIADERGVHELGKHLEESF